ncbi:cyclic nucleotide-binding domain-containing protein [Tumidithrix elongata RA019]|uniref:Cyclic nucleotide-binding domain-containing protein n=1 Tax=Tumidithrix elongata BACA0141 TaxID=2716417 RepID=A0AAW9PYG5_9CYAN|nr:cyclic nucleotide-binding domain-containing protein [Tumidithrix elongata RA019]
MLDPVKTISIFQKTPDPKTFKAGETIFEAGQTGDAMYGIIEGEVNMVVNAKVIETLTKGKLFGEGALIHDDHKRASTAIAKTDCQLAYLPKLEFLFAVQETPEFALQVMRNYSDRLRQARETLSSLSDF